MTAHDKKRRGRAAKRAPRVALGQTVERLPGCLWINRGRWAWRVTLPGRTQRENIPLRIREGEQALDASQVPRVVAEGLAWGLWRAEEERVASMVAMAPQDLPRVRGMDAVAQCTVAEAVDAYLAAARIYYAQSREAGTHAWALRPLVEAWGALPLGALACAELLDLRDGLVARGLARRSVNHVVGVWRLWARWCQDQRLCGVATMQELAAVQSLRRGRSAAREPEPVRAVPHWRVRAAAPWMSDQVRRMVRLQECSGMRPGEVCAMRWDEVERAEPCWIYRPHRHKNAWRGQPRAVALGPGARRVLEEEARVAGSEGYVFAPRVRAQGARRPGARWTREGYTRAVERAVDAAVAAGRLAEGERWSPHALRHSAGTRVRRACGLEAARAVLGHSMRGGVTDVYTYEAAEREMLRAAVPAAARWG